MGKDIIVESCITCGERITAYTEEVLSHKKQEHMKKCHPGFERIEPSDNEPDYA